MSTGESETAGAGNQRNCGGRGVRGGGERSEPKVSVERRELGNIHVCRKFREETRVWVVVKGETRQEPLSRLG